MIQEFFQSLSMLQLWFIGIAIFFSTVLPYLLNNIIKKYPKIYVKEMDGSRSAYNTTSKVVIDPRAHLPQAILAQEVFESMWRRYLYRYLWRRFTNSGKQTIEIMGQESEVQYAAMCGLANEEEHRIRKANVLHDHDDDFRGVSVEKIIKRMENVSSKQQKWVKKHKKFLDEWKRKIEDYL